MRKVNVIKGLAFMGLAAGVITLSGCGEKVDQLKDMKNDVTSKIDDGKQMVDENKGMLGGLKDAMKNGVAMKCESTKDDWVTYTNGKKMRSEGTEDGKKQNMLMIDGVTYTWEEGSATGMKIDSKCFEDMQADMDLPDMSDEEFAEDEFTFEDLETEEEAGSVKCAPSTEADFSIPSDIKFEDQCKIMKEQMKGFEEQMKNMPEIPSM